MSPSVAHILDLSETEWSALEAISDRFEEAWNHGEPPTIIHHVPSEPELHDAAPIELVHSDLEFRLASGDLARVEHYLERFPSLATDPEVVAGLIEAEWRARGRRGELCHHSEFLDRFLEHRHRIEFWPAHGTRATPPQTTTQTRASAPDDGETRESAPRPSKFLLLGELGRGSFGVVYRARDTELDRLVALKIPGPATVTSIWPRRPIAC